MAGAFKYRTNELETGEADFREESRVFPLEEIDVLRAGTDKSEKTRGTHPIFSPSELRGYEPEKDIVLVGDCHIMRGEVFVIGGEPGVGKSTAATELAICGATGRPWLGLPVHCRFKTMIIQTENGRYRLRQEYQARGALVEIEDSIRVSEPPPYGLTPGILTFNRTSKQLSTNPDPTW